MIMKTTNYYDTFIEVADDCPVEAAEVPPMRGAGKTAARLKDTVPIGGTNLVSLLNCAAIPYQPKSW